MTDDLHTITERLLKARELHPERFEAFRSKVCVLLERLYPGQRIRFADLVKPKSMGVFQDMVAYHVLTENYNPMGGNLEYDDDMQGISRTHLYRHVRGHFYQCVDSDYQPII